MADTEDALKAQTSARNALETKIATLETELKAATAQNATAQARIAAIETAHQAEAQASATRYQKAQDRIAEMSERLGILTGQAQGHAAEKAALEARIHDLEKRNVLDLDTMETQRQQGSAKFKDL